jgi:probable F420-dependent oxidoreductase
LKIGLALPQYDFSYPDGRPADLDATIEWARTAERAGFDSVWLSDHFFLDLSRYGGPSTRYGALEPMTALSAIAVETERIELGTLVLCYAFRHPPLLAKMAATLDVISGGRLALGLGAGWYEAEFRELGFEFPPAGERMDRLREVVDIVGGMLANERFSYQGKYYRVDDAPNDPQPVQRPRPRTFVGSKGGPRSLRIVAEAADGWNTVWRWSPEAYAERAAALDAACVRVGRDPAGVRRSLGLYTLVGTDRADLEKRYRALQEWAPGGMLDSTTLDDYASDALVGTPEECVAKLERFAALGVEHFIASATNLPFAIQDPEQIDLIAETLVPKVHELGGA